MHIFTPKVWVSENVYKNTREISSIQFQLINTLINNYFVIISSQIYMCKVIRQVHAAGGLPLALLIAGDKTMVVQHNKLIHP